MEQCHGSIPIMESTVTVSRDIPAVLVGKIHWIEWSMMCDRLDEALKPLRKSKTTTNRRRGSSSSSSSLSLSSYRLPSFRHLPGRKSCLRSKTLKNLQKVCDEQVQKRETTLRDLILYCPCGGNGGDSLAMTNWHIQVVVHDATTRRSMNALPDTTAALPPDLDVPMNIISIPTPPTTPLATTYQAEEEVSRSAPFGLPFWPEPLSEADWGEQTATPANSAPFELPPEHHQRFAEARQRRQRQIRAQSATTTGHHNNAATAASATSSLSSLAEDELDRILDREFWMSAPAMGGTNMHLHGTQDTLPIPMPPPAPRAKILQT